MEEEGKHTSVLRVASAELGALLAAEEGSHGHGLDHSLAVLAHAQSALAEETASLEADTRLAILLAALLHDADDPKLFQTVDYGNARAILTKCVPDYPATLHALVIEMIDLVSCSKNKNRKADKEWKLLPRWCDRLEAVGRIGIVRCYQYNTHKGAPLCVESTARVTTEEALARVATPERYAAYSGKSHSMVDHFYDKLLHVHVLDTQNTYLLQIAQRRHQDVVDFCLAFGRTGVVDTALIQTWAKELDDV